MAWPEGTKRLRGGRREKVSGRLVAWMAQEGDRLPGKKTFRSVPRLDAEAEETLTRVLGQQPRCFSRASAYWVATGWCGAMGEEESSWEILPGGDGAQGTRSPQVVSEGKRST